MRIGEHHYASLPCTTEASTEIDVSSAADILSLHPAAPIRVLRWGLICTAAIVAGTGQAELDHTTHDEDGTPTRSAGSGGQNLAFAATKVGGIIYVRPDEEILVRPGDFLSMQISTGATSGNGIPFIEYQQLPMDLLGETSLFSDDATTRMVDASEDI